jgi:hypothetical protein
MGGDSVFLVMAPFSFKDANIHKENLVEDDSYVQDRNIRNDSIYIPKPAMEAQEN